MNNTDQIKIFLFVGNKLIRKYGNRSLVALNTVNDWFDRRGKIAVSDCELTDFIQRMN